MNTCWLLFSGFFVCENCVQMQIGWRQWLEIDLRQLAGTVHAFCVHTTPICGITTEVPSISGMQSLQLLVVGSCQ